MEYQPGPRQARNRLRWHALIGGGLALSLSLPAFALLKAPENLNAAGVQRIGQAGEDDGVFHILPTRTFSFYGQTYSGLTVSTNGWISLGDTGNTLGTFNTLTTLDNNAAGIIVNGDDWVQTDAGVTPKGYVYYKEYDDAVGVTWRNVPHFGNFDGEAPRSTFQAILYDNGYIGLSYGNLGGSDGTVVGLTSGNGQHYTTLYGPAAGTGAFANDDFSLCFANQDFVFAYDGGNYVPVTIGSPVPEPAIPAVLGLGGAMWWCRRRRGGS